MAEEEVRRLPTGAHGIPADLVARNQRERLVAAVAEACAERGYAETSVADLAARAGVSTATFYKLFPGKRDCALDAHAELLERLLEEVDRACDSGDRGVGGEGQVRDSHRARPLCRRRADGAAADHRGAGAGAGGRGAQRRRDRGLRRAAAEGERV